MTQYEPSWIVTNKVWANVQVSLGLGQGAQIIFTHPGNPSGPQRIA